MKERRRREKMKNRIRLKSTTNNKFKYMQGRVTSQEYFKIGTVIWFNDFHTSSLEKLEYTYIDDTVEIKATTLNSVYVIVIEESK